LLGLVFLAAVVLVKPIGVSTQFVIFDSILWDAVDDTVVTTSETAKSGYTSTNAYLAKSGGKYAESVSNPLNYSFVFVIAMMIGAFISAVLRGGVRSQDRPMPRIWRANFGDNPATRYAAVFFAGLLVLFGALKFTSAAHIFPYIEYKAMGLGFPFARLFYPVANWGTGALEIAAGALLLLPATRFIGARLAVLPVAGAVAFHLSPLLGVNTPTGYANDPPLEALAAGGGFVRTDFTAVTSPMLFFIAVAVFAASVLNLILHREG